MFSYYLDEIVSLLIHISLDKLLDQNCEDRQVTYSLWNENPNKMDGAAALVTLLDYGTLINGCTAYRNNLHMLKISLIKIIRNLSTYLFLNLDT